MDNKERLALLKEIRRVIKILEENKVSYAVLRNYEFLSGKSEDFDDLDILILHENFALASKILFSEGYKKRNEVFSKYIGENKFLRIHPRSERDFVEHLIYKNPRVIFEKRIKEDFYYRLSKDDYLVSLIAHSLLGKRKLQDKYKEEYKHLINPYIDREYVSGILDNSLGKGSGFAILSSIKKERFDQIDFKRYFLKFMFKDTKTFFSVIKIIMLKKFRKYSKLFKGPLICFVGPDGSGKTTLLYETHAALIDIPAKKEIIHFGSQKKGRIYRIFDLIKKILKVYLNILSGKITLTDRYIYLTFRKKPFLNKLVRFTAPKPSIVFLMSASPKVIRKRRKELSIEQIKELYEYYKKFKNMEIIKTDSDKNECKTLIMSKIPLTYG